MARVDSRGLSSAKGDSAKRKPKGWPDDIIYLDFPRLSSAVSKDSYAKLNQAPVGVSAVPGVHKGSSPVARIVTITDKSHPAYGQRGLFAAQNLRPDSFVLCYIGLVHGRDDADPTSDYDLSLDRELGIGVDASKMGNEARFVNDYRGVASAPNAEFREMWVESGGGNLEKRMGVYVLSAGKSGKRAKGIAKGHEILVSYGKGFWNERTKEPATDDPDVAMP